MSGGDEQLTLLPLRTPRTRRDAARAGTAASDPVARVQVDTGLPHLDRPFDYLVPADLADEVQPGVRVKVRFAGRDLDGFVLERADLSDHTGQLQPIRRVVSPEPVLGPALLAACQEVARRCAGSLGDVLRLAIPPRHAAAERALPHDLPPPEPLSAPGADDPAYTGGWEPYLGGPAFLDRLANGESPSASALVAPGIAGADRWPALLVDAAQATLRSGRGAILVVPDARDCDALEAAVIERFGRGAAVRLTADQGPQARYTAWLKVLRGQVRLVIGTRAAVHAPVHDLGLIAWWDDGDDSHTEQRAPYPHVRTVALVRRDLQGVALLAAGHTRSSAVQQFVESAVLKAVECPRLVVRERSPWVKVAGEGPEGARDPGGGHGRMTSLVHESVRAGLAAGPVLVQVPRVGYLPALSCQDCRQPVLCRTCHGPIAIPAPRDAPQCRWCGRLVTDHRCEHCGSTRLRARVVGANRTAEELGRAFPGVPVQVSGRAEVLGSVPSTPRIVIATPGAEPTTEEGYAAGVLLDAWSLLDRPELDAAEDTLRRWIGAAALVRPRAQGGVVVVGGVPDHVILPVVEALVRWDPGWFAARELAERRTLRLPPAAPVGTVTGGHNDLVAATTGAPWPPGARVLGPVPVGTDGTERLIVQVDDEAEQALATVLRQVRARWAARRTGEAVQVRMNPADPSR